MTASSVKTEALARHCSRRPASCGVRCLKTWYAQLRCSAELRKVGASIASRSTERFFFRFPGRRREEEEGGHRKGREGS